MDTNQEKSMIKKLDKVTVSKISAGKNIPSLKEVVKELIENSIDANSTCIEIKFKEFGKECIEVCDNGDGICEVDFEYLALPHYTSKLENYTQLGHLKSFGFRFDFFFVIILFSLTFNFYY